MVFFQAVLLLGYAYAHLGARWLSPRRQAVAHMALLALSLLALPIWPRYLDPGDAAPIPWLIGLLAVSLGVPFFMLWLRRRCCSAGSPPAATRAPTIRISSTSPAISAALPRCSAIRC